MRAFLILFVVLCLSTVIVHTSISEEANDKTIRAVRIESDESPVIDGKLDDKCWEKGIRVSDFIQFEPISGAEPKDSTNVCVLFDKQKLYVGFECLKKDPDQVLGTQMKRDEHFFQDDFVEVFLDTYHDNRNCYGFSVNCLGTQGDRRIANEGSMRGRGPMGDRSRAWDCAWEAKAARNDGGWTAEMAIPFCELRFNKAGDGTWGINFWRANEEFDEEDTWADVGEREYAVSRFGDLVGLTPEDLVVRRPLELKPYTVAKPRFSSGSEETDEESNWDGGLDIRYPSTTLTADFTLNPDFAQIEADPSQINLEDVEMRLAEKRPFFQEGMELFQAPIELFYTRRVGITDLTYGAKVVGKLGNYNIAMLDCQADDTQELDEEEEVVEEEVQDETDNNYFVFRTQRDVGTSSSIGFIGVNKQKADGYNRIGSVDLNTGLSENIRLMGQYAGSWFPDRSDDAWVVNLNGEKNPVSFELGYSDIGRDFDSESGFIPRIDRRGVKGGTSYEYNRDSKIFRSFRGRISYERLENHDGVRTNERRGIDLMTRFADFFVAVEPQWYDHVNEDDESIFYKDRYVSLFTGWFPPKWASLRTRILTGKTDGKDTFFIGPELSLVPLQRLRLELSVERMDKEDERLMLNRRLMISYQFSHDMSLRSIFEVTRDDMRNIFILYGWEFRPESDFFIVYNDFKEGESIDRVIFIKISYLLKWNVF